MTKYRLIHQSSNLEVPIGRFLIGRSTECNLVLDDASVSRVHAAIVLDEKGLFLEDLGSRNGCLINGEPAAGLTPLEDGDRVAVGHQTIRIVAVERMLDADRTVGLTACKKCGAWMASTELNCPRCGARRQDTQAIPARARETVKHSTEPPGKSPAGRAETQPLTMLTGLVTKSVSMGKLTDADRLLANLLDKAVQRHDQGVPINENELEEVNDAILALAEAQKAPEQITRIFWFHRVIDRLMPRKTVESLYGIVRKVGYRSCPEMSRYLARLAEKSGGFSPGQKFIHRRIEGLVGMCS